MLKNVTSLHDQGRVLTVQQQLDQLEDQNQNLVALLLHEFVDEHCHNIVVDDAVDTVGELGQVDHGFVCIAANVDYWVIEEESDFGDHLFAHDESSALVRAAALDDGAGGELADDGVLLLEAVHELKQDLRAIQIQSKVDLVALVEVLVDLLQDLRS